MTRAPAPRGRMPESGGAWGPGGMLVPMTPRLNHAAVLTLVVVHFLLGGAWYAAFSQPWVAAVGKPLEAFQAASSPLLYLLPLAAALLNNYLLAHLLNATGGPSVRRGLTWAALLWGALLFPYDTVHNSFGLFPFTLTLIDSGKDLVALLLSGAVLGAWRAKPAPAHAPSPAL